MNSSYEVTGSVSGLSSAVTTQLAEFVIDSDTLAMEIDPTVQALQKFEIWFKFTKAGQYVKIYSATADFTSPKGFLFYASSDLTVLAAAANGLLYLLNLRGIFSIKVMIQAAAGSNGVCGYSARFDK